MSDFPTLSSPEPPIAIFGKPAPVKMGEWDKTPPSSQFYQDALHRLNHLQTNFESKQQITALKDRSVLLERMMSWCNEIGYQPADFDTLNAIHIAGSKGKGSTAAFVFSILAEFLTDEGSSADETPATLRKIGLYTSPHLRSVRERIRIQAPQSRSFEETPLDETKFSHYVSEIWTRLGMDNRSPSQSPPFAKFLTLVGFHAFIQEGVDTAVVETCIGGRFDSTNVLRQPSVCAITSLGLEHTDILGSTIEEIAWAKGGIMKPGVPVFTVPQEPKALATLQELATKENVDLRVVTAHPDLEHIDLGLAGDFQRINASLAVAVAAEYLSRRGYKNMPDIETLGLSPLPDKFRRGLERAQWPGRCETRDHLGSRWLLDGAHTMESIELLSAWAAKRMVEPNARRVLIFNQQTKDATALLRHLRQTTTSAMAQWLNPDEAVFHQVIFCTNLPWERYDVPDAERVSMTYSGRSVEDLEVQHTLAAQWTQISGGHSAATVVRTVEEAIRCAADSGAASFCRDREHINAVVLITGSLHLVGSALEVLDTIT
ncbi:tetrahydrofolylpolyglutamate synthase [Aspergillus pseudotamarii]|uniref:Folylpolyglutamate synthase n=1 Tax=Aspergillus pseudotamarii TaxID=132259 RepID=A0A5N6SKB3_ASPPS|nr:tetrahydrofolylpolyglutamate synthase [Aspergillus pseudotamarii]KAE8135136.1 tetrahydrofolylpolyglutamate synthase [Aspergillus pseudotamarii]